MADNRYSLEQVLYAQSFLPSEKEIVEKIHELACDHLREYPFLTYNQAMEETEQNVEMWVEKQIDSNMKEMVDLGLELVWPDHKRIYND